MQYRKYFVIGCAALIFVLAGGYAFSKKKSNPLPVQAVTPIVKEEIKNEIETINPKEDISQVSFIGEVLSNKTVNIYPRRKGIVKDIYKDIGDKVYEGEVIATLLPSGIAGESNALIYEKRVSVDNAKRSLDVIESSAISTNQKSKQEVEESKVSLDYSKEEQLSKLSALEAKMEKVTADIQSSIELINKIKNSYKQESNLLSVIEQSRKDQTIVSVDNALREIVGIFGLEERTFSRAGIDETAYGVFVDHEKGRLLDSYSKVYRYLKEDIEDKNFFEIVNETLIALNATRSILQGTPPGVYLQSDLDNQILKIDQTREKLIKISGEYNETLVSLDKLVVQEQKESQVIQRQINVNNAEINRLEKELELLRVSTDKDIALKAEKLKLMMINQEKIKNLEDSKIINAQNQLESHKSYLNSAYVIKGDEKIVSAFSGVISHRFLQVGEFVDPKDPVMRLDEVNTYLSRKTPTEIEFGVPGEYDNLIEIGTKLNYFLANQNSDIIDGEVTKIGTSVDSQTKNITVRGSVPEGIKLASGENVQVHIDIPSGFSIPFSSLRKDSEGDFVWIVNENEKIEKLYVNLILKDGEFAYIKNEMDEETRILKNPLEGWEVGQSLSDLIQ